MALVIIIPILIFIFLAMVVYGEELIDAWNDHQDRKSKIKELQLKARIKEAEVSGSKPTKDRMDPTDTKSTRQLNDYITQVKPGQYMCVCEFCGDSIAVQVNDHFPTLLDAMRHVHGWHTRKGQYPVCKTCWPEYVKKIEQSKRDKMNNASGNLQNTVPVQPTGTEPTKEF